MNKIKIISDKNKRSQNIRSILLNKIRKLNLVKTNISIVIGEIDNLFEFKPSIGP